MARARNIKPSFFQNEELGDLTPITRLFFIGLWTVADYRGCVEFRPKRLRVQILPYDDCSTEELANNLERSGFIRNYSVRGQRYLKIINFEKHQNPHKNERDSGSEIPDVSYDDSQVIEIKQFENIPDKDGTAPDKDGTARADSLFLIPDSPSLIPDVDAPPASPPARPKKDPADEKETALQATCRETFRAYSLAYWDRYQTEPVVNAKVRTQIKQFCQRLPHEEAPMVAGFYVTNQAAYYVRKGHDVGSMLADAEKLRTEWATNRQITDTQARQSDRTQSNLSAADEAMRILEAAGVA